MLHSANNYIYIHATYTDGYFMGYESDTDALQADGFEDALMGLGTQCNNDVLIYDYEKCVKVLMDRDGMNYEDAVEFMDFNVCGAWVGRHTPIFYRGKLE